MSFSCTRTTAATALATLFLLALASAAGAVALGQIDDFEDGTTAGWSEGAPSPNPPENVASGGPDGADDNYLGNTSSGGFGAGSRLVMFNTAQWTGDYTSEGIIGLQLSVANLGNAPLHLRLALQGANGTRFSTTEAIELADDGVWRTVVLGLTESSLTRIAGSGDLASTLADVNELRILSNQGGPDWIGDAVVASLGVDDLRASASTVSNESTSWTEVKTRFER